MSDLKQFAAFVKREKLNDFVELDLKLVKSFNIPLLNLFTHLSEQELKDQTRIGIEAFLDSLIAGTQIEVAKQNMAAWEEDKLPGIPKNAISVSDILLIYAAQKMSLITLIPSFTLDGQLAIDLVFQLEMYYKEVRDLSLVIINKIQEEEQVKLKESEAQYRDLFDNANDLIHLADTSGKILYVNNAWLQTMGYSTADLESKLIFDVVAEECKADFMQYRQKVLAGQEDPEGVKSVFISKDGRRIYVEGFISCKFSKGIPAYTRAILRDITKRIDYELKLNFYNEQLLEREENINLLIQNAPDAIIVISETNQILLWNPKAENIFGWSANEVLGHDLSTIIIPKEYREAHNAGLKRYMTTGEKRVLNKTVDISAINKKGETFFVSLTVSQTKQAGKVAFVAFIRDTSQQHKNQVELDAKRRLLEKTNEELQQYAWLASHDLKEPLRKIMTFSDILLTRHLNDLPPVVQNHLKKIHISTQRMDSLIEAIMVYSNVTDNVSLFAKTNLNHIVKEVLYDLELLVKMKHAKIHVDVLPTVEAIPIQMRQLFQNIISNALKYSKSDTDAEITIESETNNGMCSIKISDNGIGFQERYAEKIFQVFQRLSTEKKYEGTGIGLALCKKIAETHNGTIEAQSTEGVGSIFTIKLPLMHDSANSSHLLPA